MSTLLRQDEKVNWSNQFKSPLIQQALKDSGYVLATFPFAIASFVVIITGLSLALGLVVVWIGVPIGVATLYAAHGFATLERRRLRVQGTIIDEVKPVERTGSVWKKTWRTLTDSGLWREALHGILMMPVMCITWSMTLSWWALAICGLTGWIWEPLSNGSSGAGPLMRLLGWPISGPVFDLIVGIFALVTLPWVVKVCCAAQVGLAKTFLSPTRASLQHRVEELAQARDQLSRAETSALRRMERDLHDGPQQTLIRLGMDLAATQRRLKDGDTDSAAELLTGARTMTDSVIADLRALSRSIAPPILAERGLCAAIMAVGATCPIPVSVSYRLEVEPPEMVATGAYFVVCEAFANAVKHSGASQIKIYVGTDDNNDLLLEITDDGQGGAVFIPGHGLAGLQDRVIALDGRLRVSGQPGTTITAMCPMC